MDAEQQNSLNIELADFAAAGDLDRVKAAVSLGAQAGWNNSAALRRAAREGNAHVVEYLAGQGADIHALAGEALRSAVANNRTMTTQALLKLGADPNVQEGEPLIKAATLGNADMVRDLLKHGANPHFSDDQALRKAAFGGHFSAVIALLSNGADAFAMKGSAVQLADAGKYGDIVQYIAEHMHELRDGFTGELSRINDTRDFIRSEYDRTGETALVRGIKMNLTNQLVARMKETGDTLSVADLHEMKDRNGVTVAQLAAERGKLGLLLDPDFWRGNLDGMKAAWDKLPPSFRAGSGVSQDTFEGIVAQQRQRVLKENAQKFKLKPF